MEKGWWKGKRRGKGRGEDYLKEQDSRVGGRTEMRARKELF